MKLSAFVLTRRNTSFEFWLWPHLLSLDAPLVAVLWQCLLARELRLRLNPFEPLVLALAVWLVYLADHLIDTRRPLAQPWEPPRKAACRRHWPQFFGVALAVALGLLACGNRLWAGTVRGGFELSIGVVGYFSLIHLSPAGWRIRWPREAAVALLFSFGAFGALWLGNGRRLPPLLAPALLFTLLCWANCSLIETWEWQAGGALALDAPNRAARWVAAHLASVGVALAVLSALFGLLSLHPAGFATAAASSAAALALLAVLRQSIPIRYVSPLADLALCSPLPVLAYEWWRAA